ncbi:MULTISPECIES: hypothetical protein [unclassified Alteromonas]|uniref:Uncharacterized protein n=1 Tax=Paraglaciecola chathamensis TaxID=368405 RepID=A0A8H9M6P6_9ALTE|nr:MULTISPECIES: hypothetical protein [unclassified Alteromonas]MAG77284.1 hypothetical protein [Colwelliaceae bacterium]MCG7643734.1 hypothetical protein [Alteromonas sp. MmMcT2-2]GGZ83014.1 hypothetical protein GCM10011274_45770 [Paraglaciecola oceanifecundans]MBC6987395.1 hypothetical protein [Alteromonas sp. BZK5]MBO7924367.1 hypothetical protein [Alteromonas sp. K632G]
MTKDENDLPEENCQVVLYSKSPTARLDAVFSNGVFKIIGHWAIKELRPEDVEIWDYKGQVD